MSRNARSARILACAAVAAAMAARFAITWERVPYARRRKRKMDKASELSKNFFNMTPRYWNGKPAWMLALVVFAQAAWLCGALYVLVDRLWN